MLLFSFFEFYFFNNFCQTNYPYINQTDIHQIYRYARTMAADEKLKLFFDLARDFAAVTNLVGKINIQSTHLNSSFA